ncbi:MAG: LON peptidase substrate-binding domain-containing protein [Planctomycetota bacterium]
MDSEALVINFDKPVRLFPLQACVLLPHATTALHVFEPRYRAMLRDALDSDGLIGMAVFAGESWRHDYEGNPPLRPCVTLGVLAKDQRLDDGRHNILLHGVCRATIENEQPLHPDGYRLATLKPFGHQPDDATREALAQSRQRIMALLDDSYLSPLAVISSLKKWLTDEVPTEVLIELAMLSLTQELEDRYAMLAQADPRKRAAMVEAQLVSIRNLVQQAEQDAGGRDEDGWSLN